MARILNHGINGGIFIVINVTVAPKNQDLQEREFGQPFLALYFGVEVLNDDKRPVLEFGIIRSVIGFEGGKFPKIVFTNFEGLHHIALRLKRKTLPAESLGQVCNGLFEDQQGRWK